MNEREKPAKRTATIAGGAAANQGAIRFGRFEIWPEQRRLRIDGRDAVLGGRAFDLLLALIERRDRVVSRHELQDLVWPQRVVEDNNLAVQVRALRKLLGADAVATVPGRGYRFTLAIDRDQSSQSLALAEPEAVAAPPTPGLPPLSPPRPPLTCWVATKS